MCGICGIISADPVHRDRVVAMTESMRHRGPDAKGFHVNGRVALGMARLKIIDLAAEANQPMTNEDGTLQVIFNGEIYNHAVLRRQLQERGHRFRTRKSDTEVLLHLYEEQGERMVSSLNGMFAFAIWDEVRQRLLVARDRLGVKPMLYAVRDGEFVFASELRAFLTPPAAGHAIDPEALALYLTFRYVPAPYTILRDVRKLEPAHYLVVDVAGPELRVQKHRYWELLNEVVQDGNGAAQVLPEEIRATFDDAVRLRLEADVPVGAFLSGGIDSTLVVAVASQYVQGLRTFTIGYDDVQTYDERRYARMAAERYGTAHEEFVLTPAQVQGLIFEVLDRMDEPFGDSSLIPSYVVSHAARQFVTVALAGDGGDELFGGYTKYRGEVAAQWALQARAVLPLVARASRLLPESRGSVLLDRVRMAKRFLRGLDDDLSRRHFNWTAIQGPDDLTSILSPQAQELLAPYLPRGLEMMESFFRATANWKDSINRILYADELFVLPYNMLAKVDMASMLNSLEVRGPFLDYRLYPLALRIAGTQKVGLWGGKTFLKRLYADLLPSAIRSRSKGGFGVPIGEWFKGPLRPLLTDVLSDDALVRRGLFSREAVGRMIQDHLTGRRDYFRELWALVCFELWAERVKL